MAVSTRTRFEVFKRDRFTCVYCGRTPPTVLLEVDHIVPRAAGGTDEITNLTTSCQDCNRGKSSNLLEEGRAPTVTREAIEDLQERIDQAKAYAELMATWRSLSTSQVDDVMEAWAKAFGAHLEEQADGTYWVFSASGYFPKRQSIRTILDRLPLHLVVEAVDITADWSSWPSERATRYFYGVCWKRIRERDEPGDEP